MYKVICKCTYYNLTSVCSIKNNLPICSSSILSNCLNFFDVEGQKDVLRLAGTEYR